MRVGILISSLHGGGAEVVARNWCLGLQRRGHEVVLLTMDGSHDDPAIEGARRDFDGSTRWRRWVGAPLWLRRTVRDEQCDVVVSLLTFPNLLLLLSQLGTKGSPVVVSEHCMSSMMIGAGPGSIVKRWLARFLYRRADGVVAVSHAVGADLVARWAVRPDRLWMIPNPVVDVEGSEHAGSVPSVTVGYVGRLVPLKRPERVLETVGELVRLGVDARCVIIGDGPMRPALQAQADDCDIECAFLGWLDEWSEHAPAMDCVVLPSDAEGFGNVLVEAASLGVAVVAPGRALGVGDAVVPGVTGVLALSARPRDLADAVLAAVAQRGEDPRSAWLRWFSIDNSAARLDRVLAQVARA
jgi:glycosyltransferase involved in cell wall biosynthesis